MADILVVGSINMDMVITTHAWARPGETVRGSEFMLSPGGKGANQAVAAAKLGARTALNARIGDDLFGKNLIESAAGYGVDVLGVPVTPGVSSGVAVITLCNGENTIIIDAGANARLFPADIVFKTPPKALIVQLEIPYETVYAALKAGRSAGSITILNPAPAPASDVVLPEDFYACIDVLTPNETECQAITGICVDDEASAFEALDALRALGVGRPVITLGEKGAAFWDGVRNRLMPAVPAKAIDTTAAGDTFTAALGVALAEGAAMEDAIDFARHAAAITVSRMGAQRATPERAEVEALMKGKG